MTFSSLTSTGPSLTTLRKSTIPWKPTWKLSWAQFCLSMPFGWMILSFCERKWSKLPTKSVPLLTSALHLWTTGCPCFPRTKPGITSGTLRSLKCRTFQSTSGPWRLWQWPKTPLKGLWHPRRQGCVVRSHAPAQLVWWSQTGTDGSLLSKKRLCLDFPWTRTEWAGRLKHYTIMSRLNSRYMFNSSCYLKEGYHILSHIKLDVWVQITRTRNLQTWAAPSQSPSAWQMGGTLGSETEWSSEIVAWWYVLHWPAYNQKSNCFRLSPTAWKAWKCRACLQHSSTTVGGRGGVTRLEGRSTNFWLRKQHWRCTHGEWRNWKL